MTNTELAGKLNSLIKLDNDALHSYDKVIDAIDHPEIKLEIIKFRDDHRRHVDNLSFLVQSMNETPARKESDIIGTFLGGATIIQNLAGIEGSLRALHTGEKLTNKNYADAVKWDVPADVRVVLQANYSDEQRHISFVEKAIRDKIWEKR
jgi:demethoxyubiquinone hydroxylase (CLK1/Coq7/Cat5 family)